MHLAKRKKESWILGLDIGGSQIKSALISDQQNFIDQEVISTHSFPKFQLLEKWIQKKIEKAPRNIQGLAIGAPNTNFFNRKMTSPINIPWGDIPLGAKLEKKLQLPVATDNDANVWALAELHQRSTSKLENFMVLTLGTGVGTGFVLGKQILRSPLKMTGEGGHITIIDGGLPCPCGGKGHLESYLGGRSLLKRGQIILKKKSSLHEMIQLYQDNHPIMKFFFNEQALYLSMGLAQFHQLFSLQRIILGGGVTHLGPHFLKQVQKNLQVRIPQPFYPLPQVTITKLCPQFGALQGLWPLFLEHKKKMNL